MVNSAQKIQKIRIKCPECSNYMTAEVKGDGSLKGNCFICKSTIMLQQFSFKEKRMRIIKN